MSPARRSGSPAAAGALRGLAVRTGSLWSHGGLAMDQAGRPHPQVWPGHTGRGLWPLAESVCLGGGRARRTGLHAAPARLDARGSAARSAEPLLVAPPGSRRSGLVSEAGASEHPEPLVGGHCSPQHCTHSFGASGAPTALQLSPPSVQNFPSSRAAPPGPPLWVGSPGVCPSLSGARHSARRPLGPSPRPCPSQLPSSERCSRVSVRETVSHPWTDTWVVFTFGRL